MSKLTLEEAIKHCEVVAEQEECFINYPHSDIVLGDLDIESRKHYVAEQKQLAEWLTELKELREQSQKAKAMLLDSSYTLDIMCNKISGSIGCEKCTYYNPETHDCEVRAYIARTRAFVKGGKNDA